LLKGMAKKGVHVVITTGNYEDGALKLELEGLNQDLRRVAALDPEQNKEEIAKFFGMFYDQDKALECQKKLQETITGLKPGEEVIQGVQKNPDTIVRNFITVDGKEADLIDKVAAQEGGEGAGEAGFGMLSSTSLLTDIFQEAPEEFSDAEDQFLYHNIMKEEEQ
jgi:hypothetical protein